MSDVIDFLEKLGQDSTLRHASRAELDGALTQARLNPQVRAALASGDARALELLLSAGNVCCLIHVPLEESEKEPAQKKDAGLPSLGSSSSTACLSTLVVGAAIHPVSICVGSWGGVGCPSYERRPDFRWLAQRETAS